MRSIAKLNRKLEDVVFYEVNGKTFVRAKRTYFSDMVKTSKDTRQRASYRHLSYGKRV